MFEWSPWRRYVLGVFAVFAIVAFVPVASYLYATIGKYAFTPTLWISGVYHEPGSNPVFLATLLGLVGSFAPVIGLGLLLAPRHPLFGAARFANIAEIRQARLFKPNTTGVVIGRYRGKLLTFHGDLHVYLAAQTGSGKGVGFVVPNMLHWSASAIVLDIKKENYRLTAGYRRKVLGQHVHIFDPLEAEGRTERFNALDYIRTGDHRITDMMALAEILVPLEGSDPHWPRSARKLFVGLACLVLDVSKFKGWPASIGQINRLINTATDTGEFLTGLLASLDTDGIPVSHDARVGIMTIVNQSEKPRKSIISALQANLALWSSPLVDRATSDSDFDLREFRRHPTTLYVASGPDDLITLGPVLRLLLETFIGQNTRSGETPEDDNSYRYEVLCLYDEFLALGAMTRVVKSLSYVRGWGIRFATVIQSKNQLVDEYGDALATFYVENHRASIAFRPASTDDRTPRELSDKLGTTTVKSRSVSRGRDASRNVTTSDASRAVVTPDEVANMPDDRCFVFVDGVRPIFATKIRYYADPLFRKRLLPAPPLPAALTTGLSVPAEGDAQAQAATTVPLPIIHVPPGRLSDYDLTRVVDQLFTLATGAPA